MQEFSPEDRQLTELAEMYQEDLLRVCFLYLQDQGLAEDAVQETFLKAYHALPWFRGNSNPKTWLTRIAVNACKDLMKSAWARKTDRSVTPDALPEGAVPFEARDDTVTRAVLALPPKMKEAVLLRWYQGLTLEEMARVLRLPRSTVNYRLKKAKALLRDELEEWYDEE